MNDDQMVQLLRDVPLPAEPMDRYAAVAGRRRRADGRRLTVVGASLAVVALVATVSVVTLRDSARRDIATVLSSTQARTAHVEGSVKTTDGKTLQTYVGDIDFARGRFSIRATGRGQDVEFRMIDDDVWFKGDAFFGGSLHEGKAWLHSQGDSAGAELRGFDPAKLLATLRDSKATVEAKEEAVIDGVATTRYDVTLPAGSKREVFPDGSGEIFVDGSGLVRRLRYPETDSDPATINELTFSDFGKALDIQPPPASEVAEQGDLTQGLTTSTCVSGDGASEAPSSPAYSSSCTITGSLTGPATAEQNAKVCEQIRSQPVSKEFTQERKNRLTKSLCG